MKHKLFVGGIAAVAFSLAFIGGVQAGSCPAVTVADSMGVGEGAYPQQYDLAEFEALGNCAMRFSENPRIAEMNSMIIGNPALPPLVERLPEEPLVVRPLPMTRPASTAAQ